jgi:hypothetical protein
MWRALIHIVGILVLAAGPVLPYFHLTTSPHRFCPHHGNFELVHTQPEPPQPPENGRQPGDKDQDHEICLIATLILQLVNHRSEGTPLAHQPEPRRDRSPRPLHLPLHRERNVVTLAPKTSPPSPLHVS